MTNDNRNAGGLLKAVQLFLLIAVVGIIILSPFFIGEINSGRASRLTNSIVQYNNAYYPQPDTDSQANISGGNRTGTDYDTGYVPSLPAEGRNQQIAPREEQAKNNKPVQPQQAQKPTQPKTPVAKPKPKPKPKPQPPTWSGNAKDFTLTYFSGTRGKVSDFAGMPLILNFWSAGCGPCLTELPILEELRKIYSGRIEIVCVALSKIPDPEQLVANNGYKLRFAYSDKGASLYKVKAIPLTIFIDKNGQIIHQQLGALSIDEFKNYIGLILK